MECSPESAKVIRIDPSSSVSVKVENGERLRNLSLAADGGASYVCERCGSVISVARQVAHNQTWCPAFQGGSGGGGGRLPGEESMIE